MGMWMVAWSMASRIGAGTYGDLADVLGAYRIREGIEAENVAIGIAEDMVYFVFESERKKAKMWTALCALVTAKLRIGMLPSLPYCLSRQDVERDGLMASDYGVALVDGKEEMWGPGDDVPDVKYRLHLYRYNPWAQRDIVRETGV
jgi:hypothetical protein